MLWVEIGVIALIALSVKAIARSGATFEARMRRANVMLGLAAAAAATVCVTLHVAGTAYGIDRQAASSLTPFVFAVFMLPVGLGWRDARREAREDKEQEERLNAELRARR